LVNHERTECLLHINDTTKTRPMSKPGAQRRAGSQVPCRRRGIGKDAPPQVDIDDLLPVVQAVERSALRATPGIVEKDSHLETSTCSLVSSPIWPKLRQNKTTAKKARNNGGNGSVRTSPNVSNVLSLSRCTCSRLLTSVGMTRTLCSPISAAISRPSVCRPSVSTSARTIFRPFLCHPSVNQSQSFAIRGRRTERVRARRRARCQTQRR
jgi:hypothetical protein